MKLRKAIKRIAALGIGATMVGATIFGAMAADLSEYPKPFISDGKFSGVLVIGDKAAAEDVIGVSDIAMSLQYAATTKVSTKTTATTAVEGDAWRADAANKLEITENLDAGTNQEGIVNVTKTIDEDELAALADGEISNDKGTAGYNQYIHFTNSSAVGPLEDTAGFVFYTEDDDDVTGDFLYFKSGDLISRYQIEFKTNFESDVEDSTGASDTTGLFLGDYEDEKLKILGKEFEIVKAKRITTVGNSVELTLMGGAVKDTLQEGETKTYTIDGKDYEVTVTGITDTGTIVAKFTINGETTQSLTDGSSDRMSDGIEIGVTDILPNEAGDVSQDIVTFYLGANKVYMKDTNVYDKTSSNSLEYGSERIEDSAVYIEGSDDNSTFAISSISVITTADDDYFVSSGGKLTALMKEPQALLGSYDIEYKGLETTETHPIKIKTSGSDQYELEFTDAGGQQATVPVAYTASGTNLKFGDDDDDLIVNESMNITKNDYFVVSDYTLDRGRRSTYALRYKGADKSTDSNPVIRFDLMGSGERVERTYSKNQVGGTADATIKLGGQTYNVFNVSEDTSADFTIMVDLDADSDANLETLAHDRSTANAATAIVVNITTKDGAMIGIENMTTGNTIGEVKVTIDTPHTDDYDNKVPTPIMVNLTASGGEVRLSEISNHKLKSPQEDKYHSFGYTTMGTYIDLYSPTSDPQTLTIDYPTSQRKPQVFVTAGVTTTSVSEAGTQESVTIQRIEVGATKLASEVAGKETSQNVIAVGGPCANAAAETLMGLSCEAAATVFEPGKGLIQLYENDANVGLVVAGYSAADTRAASTIVANYGDYALSGAKMEVTTATSSVTEVTTA